MIYFLKMKRLKPKIRKYIFLVPLCFDLMASKVSNYMEFVPFHNKKYYKLLKITRDGIEIQLNDKPLNKFVGNGYAEYIFYYEKLQNLHSITEINEGWHNLENSKLDIPLNSFDL